MTWLLRYWCGHEPILPLALAWAPRADVENICSDASKAPQATEAPVSSRGLPDLPAVALSLSAVG